MAACLGVLFTFLTHYNGTSLFLVEHCYTGSGWFIRAKSYWQTCCVQQQSQSGIAIDPTGTGITMFPPRNNAVPLVVQMGIRTGSPRDKLLTTMERYLSTSTSAPSDDIILAPY